ncbi:hypothetical protein E6O75_ATG02420 [Venturia nashicola]|uniref:Uncharacterized protein n=1 Tax=Venturia nashicola TaxID=86259 RepID=A0A4Z1P6Z0_9PEZI|nr:hypothetical protein E6O75_ATG02420 [Venturia nashicola]
MKKGIINLPSRHVATSHEHNLIRRSHHGSAAVDSVNMVIYEHTASCVIKEISYLRKERFRGEEVSGFCRQISLPRLGPSMSSLGAALSVTGVSLGESIEAIRTGRPWDWYAASSQHASQPKASKYLYKQRDQEERFFSNVLSADESINEKSLCTYMLLRYGSLHPKKLPIYNSHWHLSES